MKVCKCICLSPHGAELGPSKDWYASYIIWYLNCKLHSFGLNAAKNIHDFKQSFKWKLFKIKFRAEKSASAYVYLPMEWSYDPRKIDMFLILYGTETVNYIQFRAPATNTHYFKKSFKWKLFKIEFRTGKSASVYVYLPTEWS